MRLWKDLLFLHGHVADASLARSLADAADAAATQAAPDMPRRHRRVPPLARLAHNFLLLGGRPMHAGHNFDVEEPFDPPPAPPCLGRTDSEIPRHA